MYVSTLILSGLLFHPHNCKTQRSTPRNWTRLFAWFCFASTHTSLSPNRPGYVAPPLNTITTSKLDIPAVNCGCTASVSRYFFTPFILADFFGWQHHCQAQRVLNFHHGEISLWQLCSLLTGKVPHPRINESRTGRRCKHFPKKTCFTITPTSSKNSTQQHLCFMQLFSQIIPLVYVFGGKQKYFDRLITLLN